MLMCRSDSGVCRHCGGRLLYGVKEEPELWKVYIRCDECGREFVGERIRRSEISHIDDVYARAERVVDAL